MNKTAIKNFAIWARNKLIADISYRAGLMGIAADGIHAALPQSTGQTEFYDIGTAEPYAIKGEAIRQRRHLVELIQRKEKDTDYKTAYKYIIEEVAYTWFNRLIAVRFMEVNDYLPSHIRVLSSDTGKMEPDLVTTPFDAELEFTNVEQQTIIDLKNANKLDEVFRMLFIKQCNALNEILPALFEKTNDYTELLLNLSVIDQDGVVYHLVHDIPEEDFDIKEGGQIEIIGWFYQFYNTELNEQVYDGNLSKGRIDKDLLPAATTIYTPDWAIQYMVQNSLGKLWLETHEDSGFSSTWKYFLAEEEQEETVNNTIRLVDKELGVSVENIKFIDPCMGSGHILVYAFELLIQIYESQGYLTRDIPQHILNNNLYGVDIDTRAAQIAYFAVMMKARQYDRRIFKRDINPHIYTVKESNSINRNHFKMFGNSMEAAQREKARIEVLEILDSFTDAKEYGSILNIREVNWDRVYQYLKDLDIRGQLSFDTFEIEQTQRETIEIIDIARVLASKYHVVCTNPPYLGNSRFSPKLDKYVKQNYPLSKADLSMVMYQHAMDSLCIKSGYMSFITTTSWMFLSSFEKLREYANSNISITSLVDFGTELFEGKVGHNPIVSWVARKTSFNYRMTAIRLVEYCYSRRDEKEPEFFNLQNRYIVANKDYQLIPGAPIAYWVSQPIIDAYKRGISIDNISLYTGSQNITADNEKYLRNIWEVDHRKVGQNKKWSFYIKGGPFRKWYGNIDLVVNWSNEAQMFYKTNKTSNLLAEQYRFKEGITYTELTSGTNSFRYLPPIAVFDKKGPCIVEVKHNLYCLAFFNSCVAQYYFKLLNPTITLQVKDVKNTPIIIDEEYIEKVENLARECVSICKEDWDSFENAWEFNTHPLIRKCNRIEEAFSCWAEECMRRQMLLKDNEEHINSIFMKIYQINDEMQASVDDRNITVQKPDLAREIKSLISYAIGCMFGRYSLDKTGVVCAGEELEPINYKQYMPDADGIIPITDEEYLEDDIVARFCDWIKVVYGQDTLEDNLDYIARAISNKNTSSRDVIRSYFINDFFKNHCTDYSANMGGKRPIYWLFDSGKQNGFKALIYLHRYNADTIGNLRIDYLHRMQRVYESEISRMQDMIDHSTNAREVGQATKRRDKLTKQLKECREYDEKLAHLALSRIELDLDDGVKVNYRKLQTANDGKFYEVLADSKNIMAKK